MQPDLRTKGFTLIELLVVIAIIAILAAILFPVFAKAREKARQTSCLSNMKQVSLGVLQYLQDNNEMFPCGYEGGPEWTYGEGWAGSLQAYIKSAAVFKCPDDSTTDGTNVNQQTTYPDSYGMNINLTNQLVPQTCCSAEPIIQSAMTAPAGTVMLFEITGDQTDLTDTTEGTKDWTTPAGTNGSTYILSAVGDGLSDSVPGSYALRATEDTGNNATDHFVPQVQYATGDIAGQFNPNGTVPTDFESAQGLHTGGANYAFADGHSKWLLPSAVSGGPAAVGPDCPGDVAGTLTPSTVPSDCPGEGWPFGSSSAGTSVSNYQATFSPI